MSDVDVLISVLRRLKMFTQDVFVDHCLGDITCNPQFVNVSVKG